MTCRYNFPSASDEWIFDLSWIEGACQIGRLAFQSANIFGHSCWYYATHFGSEAQRHPRMMTRSACAVEMGLDSTPLTYRHCSGAPWWIAFQPWRHSALMVTSSWRHSPGLEEWIRSSLWWWLYCFSKDSSEIGRGTISTLSSGRPLVLIPRPMCLLAAARGRACVLNMR